MLIFAVTRLRNNFILSAAVGPGALTSSQMPLYLEKTPSFSRCNGRGAVSYNKCVWDAPTFRTAAAFMFIRAAGVRSVRRQRLLYHHYEESLNHLLQLVLAVKFSWIVRSRYIIFTIAEMAYVYVCCALHLDEIRELCINAKKLWRPPQYLRKVGCRNGVISPCLILCKPYMPGVHLPPQSPMAKGWMTVLGLFVWSKVKRFPKLNGFNFCQPVSPASRVVK